MKTSRPFFIFSLIVTALILASAYEASQRSYYALSFVKRNVDHGDWTVMLYSKLRSLLKEIRQKEHIGQDTENQQPYLHEALYAYRRFG